MRLRLTVGLGLLAALWIGSAAPGVPNAAATPAVMASPAPAALAGAPLLRSPQPGTTLAAIGPVTFDWECRRAPRSTSFRRRPPRATVRG